MNHHQKATINAATLIVPYLDVFLEHLAKLLRRVCRIEGLGAFHHTGSPHWFFGAWRDCNEKCHSYVLRLGRTELVADLRVKKKTQAGLQSLG